MEPLTGELRTKIEKEIEELICKSPQLSLDNYEDCRLASTGKFLEFSKSGLELVETLSQDFDGDS